MDTAREVFDVIDEFLVREALRAVGKGSVEGKRLWDVLSALRGPDGDDTDDLKHRQTEPIRRAAFPKLAALYDKGINIPGGAMFAGDRFIIIADDKEDHFNWHASSAARALNLNIERK